MFEPYDSEILLIEGILDDLGRKVATRTNVQAFHREMVERFEDIGIRISITWYTDNGDPEIFSPVVTLEERLDTKHEFDYDRMVHEVTNDILDILPPSEKGQTIKTQKIRPGEAPSHKH